jgi:hypothetical protein
MAANYEEHVSGVVRSVNDKGLKLEGWDTWMNVSKFAVGVVLPERGETVTCTLDKAGFLRAVAPSDGVAPVRGGSDVLAAAAAPSQKDRTITRLACLKAAAEFAASRDLKSGHVLSIAASWEKWVNRPDDEQTTYDLTDAF